MYETYIYDLFIYMLYLHLLMMITGYMINYVIDYLNNCNNDCEACTIEIRKQSSLNSIKLRKAYS